ncbi:MAG TPA: hypothetical protein VIK81_01805 [Patescibacteria group bacterium]
MWILIAWVVGLTGCALVFSAVAINASPTVTVILVIAGVALMAMSAIPSSFDWQQRLRRNQN